MNVFYVVNGRKLKRNLIIAVALIFAFGIVYAERENISVFSYNETSAIYSVDTNKKMIALTFDISWGDERAEPIIQLLKEKELKGATFFLSSPWAQDHPEIVQKIIDAGFEIGSHGHKHDFYSQLTDEDIRKQLRTAHMILSEVTGKTPTLLRLPNGDFDTRVLNIANSMNYKVIQWDTDSKDWQNPGKDEIIRNVLDQAHNGDIVLMHASDSAKQTLEALPAIIDTLHKQGYELVSVSQLLAQADIKRKEVENTNTP